MTGGHACIVAALLWSVSCGALAQVSATAGFNSLRYQLADRDPNDGIAAAATFELAEVAGTVVVFDRMGVTLDECTLTGMGRCSVGTAGGKGSAWFNGIRSGSHVEWSENASGGTYASTRAFFDYTLTPNSELSFTFDASLEEVQPGRGPTVPGDGAAGGVLLFYTGEEGFFRSYIQYAPGNWTDRFVIASRDEAITGQVRLYTDIVARYTVPAVPEPSNMVLLSAGLLLMGLPATGVAGAPGPPRPGSAVRAGRHAFRFGSILPHRSSV